jgi:glycosyltransferase involved in cell wall biosynthesis
MVSEDLPGEQVGGLGKHVVTLSNALLARGHEVCILGRSDRGREGCAEQIGFLGRFIPGFDYARPGWKELQLGVFNPLKRPFFARKVAHAINAHAAGFGVVHYHGHLPMVGLYVDPAIRYVQTRHDQGSECLTHLRFRADAVCTTTAPRDCSACISGNAGLLRKSVTALAVDGYREQAARSFASQKTVFVSDFLRRQFQRAVPHADLSRTRVIHNFIDYARLAARAIDAGPLEPGHIVMVGRVDAGKGFGEFLALAAARLPQSSRVSIVGDGPQRAALEQRYGSAQVRFLGWRDYDEALALCARAHLCVVSSVCEEACSTTVLEALALGRRCVALARGGTPELGAYQVYEGQLQLAPDMPALVERVLALLDQPPAAVALPPVFGADAALILPKLLECYAE